MNESKSKAVKVGFGVKDMVMIALVTAVICVVAPFSVPIGPIPISLATLILYLSIYVLGWKYASVSCILYLVIGLAGAPVFSGFQGGIAKLVGPTGGYLIGYIPLVAISGLLVENIRLQNKIVKYALNFVSMIAGTIVLYVLGTAWFCISSGTGVVAALGMCVIPFIPGDVIKMVIALIAGPALSALISAMRGR